MKDGQETRTHLSVYYKLRRLAARVFPQGELKKLERAYALTEAAYLQRPDFAGQAFIFFPLEFSRVAARDFGLGSSAILAALLHEAFLREEISPEGVEKEFGTGVLRISEGLRQFERMDIAQVFDSLQDIHEIKNTPISQEMKKTRRELQKQSDKFNLQMDNFRRMLLSLSEDINVILLELALHLVLIRKAGYMPADKQRALGKEVAYIYTPMAHQLGLYTIKTEMEDTSLKYTEPETYQDIAQKLEQTKDQREAYIREFIKPIKRVLKKEEIPAQIKWRTKSISSIRQKIVNKGVPFEQIFDIFAIRIILTEDFQGRSMEKARCWQAYSLITDFYEPSTARLRDWISNPRPTGYESLHTTVKGQDEKWVEVQIRTQRMDDTAERGTAAHWRYKNLSAGEQIMDKLDFIREMLENTHTEMLDDTDYTSISNEKIRQARIEKYGDKEEKKEIIPRIFVFTPKSEIRSLREGSTVLDFAYSIHSDIGEHCVGGRISGKVVPIKHQLKNGDRVEILTSNKQSPSKEWLTFLRSPRARSRVKRYLNAARNKVAKRGKAIIEQRFADTCKQLKEEDHRFKDLVLTDKLYSSLREFYGYRSYYDFLGAAAAGGPDWKQLPGFLRQLMAGAAPEETGETGAPGGLEVQLEEITKQNTDDVLILADNLSKVDVHLAPCCNPMPGDRVFGFISATSGTKIHKLSCPNTPYLMTNYPYRILEARWNDQSGDNLFVAAVDLLCSNKTGTVAKITDIISREFAVNMGQVNFEPQPDGTFQGRMVLYVPSVGVLNDITRRLAQQKEVLKIARYK